MTLEDVINSDPTLKYLIWDSQFDNQLFEHQINIRFAALKVAINKWIELNKYNYE